MKRFIKTYLLDFVVLWLAGLWAYLFISMILAPNGIISLQESNRIIVLLELALSVGIFVWVTYRIVKRIRRNRLEKAG